MKKAVIQGFKKILSPVDEYEELHTESQKTQKPPNENTRPTTRRSATAKVSYKEEVTADDEDTEPESSEDDEEEDYCKKKQKNKKRPGLKKVTKTPIPLSPKMRRSPPSPKKKKRESQQHVLATVKPPTASSSGVVKRSGSAPSPHLTRVTNFSPAQITHDMWQPHKSDWRVTDAIDY